MNCSKYIFVFDEIKFVDFLSGTSMLTLILFFGKSWNIWTGDIILTDNYREISMETVWLQQSRNYLWYNRNITIWI